MLWVLLSLCLSLFHIEMCVTAYLPVLMEYFCLFVCLFLAFSVCGLIVPQADMPFNDLGICPDIVSYESVNSVMMKNPFVMKQNLQYLPFLFDWAQFLKTISTPVIVSTHGIDDGCQGRFS